jgi:hypothetical protein
VNFKAPAKYLKLGWRWRWLSAGSSKAQELCPSITLLRHRSHATKVK